MNRESTTDGAGEVSGAGQPVELQSALRYKYIAIFPFAVDPPREDEVFRYLATFVVRDHRMGDAAWVYRADGTLIELAAEAGDPACPKPLTRVSRGMNSTIGRCVSIHDSILIRDCSREPGYPPALYPEPGVGSVICAHLTADNTCYGAIWLYSSIPNRYSDEDRAQLQTLATVAAFTISRIRLQERSDWLANHDDLTELPHRRGMRTLAQSVNGDAEQPRTVLFIDIDDFKRYNNINHAIGDQVIREVGLRLKGLVGTNGVVGRWSGDEFVAVVAMAPDACRDFARRLVDSMKTHRAAGQDVSISVGVASWAAGELEEAVRVADDGLRQAKAEGKGRSVIVDL